jgi:hypothetical protein
MHDANSSTVCRGLRSLGLAVFDILGNFLPLSGQFTRLQSLKSLLSEKLPALPAEVELSLARRSKSGWQRSSA